MRIILNRVNVLVQRTRLIVRRIRNQRVKADYQYFEKGRVAMHGKAPINFMTYTIYDEM